MQHMWHVLGVLAWVLYLTVELISPLQAADAAPKPPTPIELHGKAEKLFREGQLEAAVPLYRELAEKHADSPYIATRLAEIRRRIEACERQIGITAWIQRTFKGKAKLNGRNLLQLAYDFSDPAQLDDFGALNEGKGTCADGRLSLSAPGRLTAASLVLKHVTFEDSVSVETDVLLPATGEGGPVVSLFCDDKGVGYDFAIRYPVYFVNTQNNNVAGVSRHVSFLRLNLPSDDRNRDKVKNLAETNKSVVETGKTFQWRVVARQGTLTTASTAPYC